MYNKQNSTVPEKIGM